MLIENYRLISPEELETMVANQNNLFGYDHGRPVGFIGEHLEGSLGLLYEKSTNCLFDKRCFFR